MQCYLEVLPEYVSLGPLFINLPGSPKAALENLDAVADAYSNTLSQKSRETPRTVLKYDKDVKASAMKKQRDRSYPKPAGSVLFDTLRQMGLSSTILRQSIVTRWPHIVDSVVSKHARAERLMGYRNTCTLLSILLSG